MYSNRLLFKFKRRLKKINKMKNQTVTQFANFFWRASLTTASWSYHKHGETYTFIPCLFKQIQIFLMYCPTIRFTNILIRLPNQIADEIRRGGVERIFEFITFDVVEVSITNYYHATWSSNHTLKRCPTTPPGSQIFSIFGPGLHF